MTPISSDDGGFHTKSRNSSRLMEPSPSKSKQLKSTLWSWDDSSRSNFARSLRNSRGLIHPLRSSSALRKRSGSLPGCLASQSRSADRSRRITSSTSFSAPPKSWPAATSSSPLARLVLRNSLNLATVNSCPERVRWKTTTRISASLRANPVDSRTFRKSSGSISPRRSSQRDSSRIRSTASPLSRRSCVLLFRRRLRRWRCFPRHSDAVKVT
mmetsp:Transcript_4453/g.13315  ORF Transcript_4453/g.13315 Transcript_4453/m.13315 type:complete len:213 (-) Transcript_4453:1418-2056(-)